MYVEGLESIDTLSLQNGVFDKAFIDLNVGNISPSSTTLKWNITTVLNAEFNGSLEGGNISADGYKITHIKLLRKLEGTNDWEVINVFEYDENNNIYNFEDRYVQNEMTYIYGIMPVANDMDGDILKSNPLKTDFDGIYLTDNETNLRMRFDVSVGDVTHNNPQSISEPVNAQYPIVKNSMLNYRTGKLTVTPLTEKNIKSVGSSYSVVEEQVLRNTWINFLNNRRAKVLRMDNGLSMLITTSNVVESHKDNINGIASLTFDFTEVGKINFESMFNNGLVADSLKDTSFINEWGESIEVI